MSHTKARDTLVPKWCEGSNVSCQMFVENAFLMGNALVITKVITLSLSTVVLRFVPHAFLWTTMQQQQGLWQIDSVRKSRE